LLGYVCVSMIRFQ